MNYRGIPVCCPVCRGDLEQDDRRGETRLVCRACDRRYPVVAGIPDLRVFPDPYIDFDADRAKARQVAERADALDFESLIDFYYSITSVVPPQHARLYKRGLLAGVPRARQALNNWERAAGGGVPDGSLLEIGCGTAPLLLAGGADYGTIVGVDIALRWLVVGRKRLAEAGLDLPLICACAEALPFAGARFDRVVADSTLEHLRSQSTALREARRVIDGGGRLFVATPNRFSIGPDPHTGLPAGGMLPQRLVAAHVRRQGGIPPKRRLLSARSLRRLLAQSGFGNVRLFLPEIPEAQRARFSPMMRRAIDLYGVASRMPLSRHALFVIGPLLSAVAAPDPDWVDEAAGAEGWGESNVGG